MAVSNRAFPNIKCLLYSNSQTPFPISPALVVDDVLLGTLVPNKGESLEFQPEIDPNPTISGEWYGQASFDSNPHKLTFVRFKADGTVVFGAKAIEGGGADDVSGWMLEPRIAYLDAKIGDDEKTREMGSQTRADLNFEAIRGVWQTVISLNRKLLGTGIYNTNRRPPKTPTNPPTNPPTTPPAPELPADPNLGVESHWVAKTKGFIPKNRSLCFNIGLLGRGEDGEKSQRSMVNVEWGSFNNGGKFRLVWEDGQSIGLDKMMHPIDPETREPDESKEPIFQRVHSFSGAGNVDFKLKYYAVRVMRVAGRMLVGINEKWFWYLETEPVPDKAKGLERTLQSAPIPVDVGWGKGRIRIEIINARVRFEVGVIKYSTAKGVPVSGHFTRRIKRREPVDFDGIKVTKGGWEKDGTSIGLHFAWYGDEKKLTYQCLLNANYDGIDTPFLSKVLLQKDTAYTNPTAQSIPIEGAINSIKISHSIPSRENSTGTTATVEVDMMRLRQITGEALNYATSYRLIEIMGCWGDSFGQSEAAFSPLFRGYVTSFSDDLPAFATHTRTLRCRDMTCLLQAPAGFIDHRYAPLDIFFANKAKLAMNNLNQIPDPSKAMLFGYEMVREILRVERGSDFVDKLQVIFPKGQYPLLSTLSDRCGYVNIKDAFSGKQAPSNNGFMFPPPYKSHIWDWIKTIAELDGGVFCMAYPKDDRTQWPVPTYAHRHYWFSLLDKARRNKTWVVPDNVYPTQTWQHLMEAMSIESRADRDYNHFFAASTGGDGKDLGGMMPGMMMSEAYLESGPNRAIQSWRRTLDLQNDMAWVVHDGTSGVERLTSYLKLDLEGVDLLWPQVTIPGEPQMAVADIVKIYRETGFKAEEPLQNSFSAPAGRDGFAEVFTRIQTLDHEINLNGGGNARRWTTKLQLRPLLNYTQ